MIKSLKLIIVFLISFNALAYNDTNSYFRVEENKFPLTVEAVLTAEQMRDHQTFKHDGVYAQADLAATYSVDSLNDLRLYVSAVQQMYVDREAGFGPREDEFSWDLTEFMYRRNNLLNETDHGVALNMELKNYFLLNPDRRELYGFDGAFIGEFIFKKHWSRRFINELKLRHHFYYKNNGKVSTLADENRVYLTSTYVITRKFFVSTLLRWKNKIRGGEYFSHRTNSMQPKVTNEIIVRPSLLFLASHKVMLEAYWESLIANTSSDRFFRENWSKDAVLGFSAYITAF